MVRILILGCAGSGKSTLARRLGEATGTPVNCLDAMWRRHWTRDNVSEFRALVEEAHTGDEWISDGNFSVATFDIRLPRATHVVWLESTHLACSWRAVKRIFRTDEHHQKRNILKVLMFILNFDRVNRPRIEGERVKHGPDVPIILWNSRRDTKSLLALLGHGSD